MVRAADKAHYTTAAVDAELGRVQPAADAVRHRRTHHLRRGHCGIDRPSGVFSHADAVAAGEDRGNLAHIGHRHHHGDLGRVGVAAFGRLYDDVIHVVAACIGR